MDIHYALLPRAEQTTLQDIGGGSSIQYPQEQNNAYQMSLISLTFQGGLSKDIQKYFEHRFIVVYGLKEILDAVLGTFCFILPA